MCIVTASMIAGAGASAAALSAAASTAFMANLAIATTAVSLGGTAMMAQAQGQQAKEQAEAQNKRYKAMGDAAAADYRFNVAQMVLAESQETAGASVEAQNIAEAGRANVATFEAVKGAQGVGGTSVDEMVSQFRRLEYADAYNLDRNLEWRRQQRRAEMVGLASGFQQRLASAAPNKIYGPSNAALLVGMTRDVLGGVNMFYGGLTDAEKANLWS